MRWSGLAFLVGGLFTLLSCSPCEECAIQDIVRAECDWLVPCGDEYDNRADCRELRYAEATEIDPDPSCVFDATAAYDCEQGIRALTCDDDLFENYPEPCDRIFSDCEEDELR